MDKIDGIIGALTIANGGEPLLAMKIMSGIVAREHVSVESIQALVTLGLARHDVNLLDNDKPVFLLIPLGKRVKQRLQKV